MCEGWRVIGKKNRDGLRVMVFEPRAFLFAFNCLQQFRRQNFKDQRTGKHPRSRRKDLANPNQIKELQDVVVRWKGTRQTFATLSRVLRRFFTARQWQANGRSRSLCPTNDKPLAIVHVRCALSFYDQPKPPNTCKQRFQMERCKNRKSRSVPHW